MDILGFYKSTVGKKVIVAVTGLVLFAFVVLHMLGNLKAFAGADPISGIHKLDFYGEFLRTFGQDMLGREGVLWITRIVLLVAAVLHIVTVIQLQILNKKSRPVAYAKKKNVASSFAAKTMAYGGLFIAVFIVLHILHFTTGQIHFQGFEHGRVYANVYSAFSIWYVALFYVVAVGIVGLHLFHGAWSVFQTLGLDNPDRNPLIRNFAKVSAVVVFLGFALVPVAIFLGLMPEPPSNFISSVGH